MESLTKMPKDDDTSVSTVSLAIDAADNISRRQKVRHSLQPSQNTAQNVTLRHTQSHNYGRRKRTISTGNKVPSIPENDIAETHQTTEAVAYGKAARENFVKKYDVKLIGRTNRRTSDSRKGSISSTSNGYDNAAFDGSSTSASNNQTPATRNVSRKISAAASARSSVYEPSENSLRVIREQYCCCSRWSRCERFLMIAVGILAIIIVILVITVGFLAKDNQGVGTNFHWTF